MRTVLIVADGSARGEAAALSVVDRARREQIGAIHLINVQRPLGAYIGRFVGNRAVRGFLADQGTDALAGAKRILTDAGLAFSAHVYVGEPAGTIARTATELRADEIVMGANTSGLLDRLALRLLTGKLMRLTDVPVVLVTGTRAAPAPDVKAGWQPA